MTTDESSHAESRPGPWSFATIHWSEVLASGQRDTRGGDALAHLCNLYWYPLYDYESLWIPKSFAAVVRLRWRPTPLVACAPLV
jgi:hypothetical protein